MGVSPFLIFLRKHDKDKSLNSLPIGARGRKLGEMYRRLSATEKGLLAKEAKATQKPKSTKVQPSVRAQARKLGIPIKLVTKSFPTTKGYSTVHRLHTTAAKNHIKVRIPRKVSFKKTGKKTKK